MSKKKNIVSVISVVLLLLAIPDIWPYGYYVFLRWIITASALFLVWISYRLKNKSWLILMAMVALLFNPIVPIYLDKGNWIVIDFIVAILFLVSIFKIKTHERKN